MEAGFRKFERATTAPEAPVVDTPVTAAPEPIETPGIEAIAPASEEVPAAPKRTRRKKAAAPEAEAAVEAPAPEPVADAKPKRTRRKKADVPVVDVPSADLPEPNATETATLAATDIDGASPPDDAAEGSIDSANPSDGTDGPDGSPRRGWWQRTFGA